MKRVPPRVFISYSHDSEKQIDRVVKFSNQLRAEGINSIIDYYEPSPIGGWADWISHQIRKADFILVVCNETYNRRFYGQEVEGIGKGVAYEGKLVRRLIYEQADKKDSKGAKFIAITLNAEDLNFIPFELRLFSFYNVAQPRQYAQMYRQLTNQEEQHKPPIGNVKSLPAKIATVEPTNLGPLRDANSGGPPLGTTLGFSDQRISTALSMPTIYAKFKLKKGNPVVLYGESYKIWVAIRNVPDGTEKVKYEILDDTFEDPKFSVKSGKQDFAGLIESYGDVFLTAKGKSKGLSWKVQTTLGQALRVNYGFDLKETVIRKAIVDIENN